MSIWDSFKILWIQRLKLFYFVFRSLLTADLEQKSIERIPVSVDNVVATTSDMHNGIIYWSDMDIKKIMRMEKVWNCPTKLSFKIVS